MLCLRDTLVYDSELVTASRIYLVPNSKNPCAISHKIIELHVIGYKKKYTSATNPCFCFSKKT
jgi:hypothetical protein